MEEKSTFENISDRHLFYYMQALVKVIGKEQFKRVSLTDYDFADNCDEAGSIVGIKLNYPIDQNYIMSFIELNLGYDFLTRTPEAPFERPQRGVYKFRHDERRTEWVVRTYENEIVSYSADLVRDTVESMEQDGNFYYGDGEEVDIHYDDSETTDVNFLNDSIKKIG